MGDEGNRQVMAGSSPPILTFACPVREIQQALGACSTKPGPDPEESFELLDTGHPQQEKRTQPGCHCWSTDLQRLEPFSPDSFGPGMSGQVAGSREHWVVSVGGYLRRSVSL